jgi:DNA invertase Pin-like site-specific DNA recombinase
MAIKAVSYLRVSGQDQVDGDGFPRQREAIARYAATHGIELCEEYREEGVSGTNELANRAALSELLERISSNGVRLVLVENATRLARDLMIQETILDELRKLGVTVMAADGVDLTVADGDPTRTLIRQILGAVAQFEKSMIVAKLKAARDRMKRNTNRCEGRKPYGTRPGEADILQRIRQLRRKPRGGERLGFRAIAETLNSEGKLTRSGRAWSRQNVEQVLKRAHG